VLKSLFSKFVSVYLSAKIQGLKKSCAKGDKKKKKELTEEIARLEAELDKRQEEEVLKFKSSAPAEVEAKSPKTYFYTEKINHFYLQEVVNQVESLTLDQPQASKEPRVTKAQKRRDKKAEKDKEREAEIALQEQENKLGPRHREEVRIKEILTARKLKIVEVPSNGDWYLNIAKTLHRFCYNFVFLLVCTFQSSTN
jgi:OTU domain-containing protein 6